MTPGSRDESRRDRDGASAPEPAGEVAFPVLQRRHRRRLRELEDEVRLLRVLVEISRATGRSDR